MNILKRNVDEKLWDDSNRSHHAQEKHLVRYGRPATRRLSAAVLGVLRKKAGRTTGELRMKREGRTSTQPLLSSMSLLLAAGTRSRNISYKTEVLPHLFTREK